MSLTSSGADCGRASGGVRTESRQLPFDKTFPVSAADPHHQREAGQAAAGVRFCRGGGAQRGQPVDAEEVVVDEQGAGAAAADHVERLGAGEPGADRDQRGPRGQRAEGGEDPGGRVGAPDGDPVAGGDAVGDQPASDRADPLVQLPVAEPRPAGLGQRLRVAELPGRVSRPRPGSSPGSSAPPLDPTKQVLGRVAACSPVPKTTRSAAGSPTGSPPTCPPSCGARAGRGASTRRSPSGWPGTGGWPPPGWTCLGWPAAHGGHDATLRQQMIFYEEYARSRAPARVAVVGEELLGPTLIAFGTPEQQRRFLPPIAAVEELWCQGYSEPGARLRPGGGGHHRGARRRRVGDQRPEGVDVACARGGLVLRACEDRARVTPFARPVVPAGPDAPAGCHGPADPPADRHLGVQRGVLRPGADRARQRGRRAWRRLADREGDAGVRARGGHARAAGRVPP